jgi:aspartate/methionine/tyrosine aminotransferase
MIASPHGIFVISDEIYEKIIYDGFDLSALLWEKRSRRGR